MKLSCPSCGAINSAEAWLNDANIRQCMKIVAELPWEVSRRSLQYIALFRPRSGRGLTWSKSLKLLSDLKDKVTHPYIQWEKQPARPNSSNAWAQAMEKVIQSPPRRLPLKNHNYLRAITYEIADEMDRQKEVRRNQLERDGGFTRTEPEMTIEEMKRITEKNYRKKLNSK